MIIKNKFSTNSSNSKSFKNELEKASQAVYGCSYSDLQELPANGKPSKHYLRKQYIKNKKFIGLPSNLKNLSNTKVYKDQQKTIVIKSYDSFIKKYGKTPSVLQMQKHMNELQNTNKDNRKFIKKILETHNLKIHKKK